MDIRELLKEKYGDRLDFETIVNHAKDLRAKYNFDDEQILASTRTCYGLEESLPAKE